MSCTFVVDVNVLLDLGPSLQGLLTTIGVNYVAKFDELKSKIQEVSDAFASGKTEIMGKIDAEKAQVAQAISDLETKLGEIMTTDQFNQISADLDALKDAASNSGVGTAIEGIFEPSATEPTTPTTLEPTTPELTSPPDVSGFTPTGEPPSPTAGQSSGEAARAARFERPATH